MSDAQFYFLSYNSDNHQSQIQELIPWLDECTRELTGLVQIDISTSNQTAEDYTAVTQQISRASIFICLLDEPGLHQLQELSYANRLNKPIIIIQSLGTKDMLASPLLSGLLCLGIPFRKNVFVHALQYWPKEHEAYNRMGEHRPHYYPEMILSNL